MGRRDAPTDPPAVTPELDRGVNYGELRKPPPPMRKVVMGTVVLPRQKADTSGQSVGTSAQVPRQAPELDSVPVHERTVPGVAPPNLATFKNFPPRKDSPPPISRPPPDSTPTTPTERDLARLRAEVAQLLEERQRVTQALPAYIEPAWWRTSGGMVRVLGALFAGLATLGVGAWMSSKAEEKPAPPPATVPACPRFIDPADKSTPEHCIRLQSLETRLNTVEGWEAARRDRQDRERQMLGELPEVKKPAREP